jgi:hypothetical protein
MDGMLISEVQKFNGAAYMLVEPMVIMARSADELGFFRYAPFSEDDKPIALFSDNVVSLSTPSQRIIAGYIMSRAAKDGPIPEVLH